MYPQNGEGKGVSRLLLWGLFIYEALRLAVLARIMGGGTGDGEFPSLIFGTPNALFLLMALFMLADFNRYTVYAPLYTAGKVLSILVLAGSGFFWRDKIVQTILLNGLGSLYAAAGLAVIALGDIFSISCGVFLILHCKRVIQGPPAADHGGL
ncbi:MAG: hypothetical protein LBU19_07220 [Treponema sp.]|jgi:hypothetical protein|nr:hypothetical protein [Treponema sp.]